MKTHLLFVVSIIISGFLYGQNAGQKQNYSQPSENSYRSQPASSAVQQNKATNYQQQQQNQPVQQNQQRNVTPVYTGTQNNSPLQYGSKQIPVTYRSNDYSLQRKNTAIDKKEEKLTSLMRYNEADMRHAKIQRINKPQLLNETAAKPHEILPLADSAVVHDQEGYLLQKNPIAQAYPRFCPREVYYITPNMRLKLVVGKFGGVSGLSGYGVHIASFLNYNYCVTVAKWLRNKYKATSYIVEDISGGSHYHLIFGQWYNYKSAQIFEGKVRQVAPYAYVFKWLMDTGLLSDNPILFFY